MLRAFSIYQNLEIIAPIANEGAINSVVDKRLLILVMAQKVF
jgi:hypothetical protein